MGAAAAQLLLPCAAPLHLHPLPLPMRAQARHSYFPAHIRFDERFGPVISRRASGRLGVDFSSFDLTSLTEEGAERQGAGAAGPQV